MPDRKQNDQPAPRNARADQRPDAQEGGEGRPAPPSPTPAQLEQLRRKLARKYH